MSFIKGTLSDYLNKDNKKCVVFKGCFNGGTLTISGGNTVTSAPCSSEDGAIDPSFKGKYYLSLRKNCDLGFLGYNFTLFSQDSTETKWNYTTGNAVLVRHNTLNLYNLLPLNVNITVTTGSDPVPNQIPLNWYGELNLSGFRKNCKKVIKRLNLIMVGKYFVFDNNVKCSTLKQLRKKVGCLSGCCSSSSSSDCSSSSSSDCSSSSSSDCSSSSSSDCSSSSSSNDCSSSSSSDCSSSSSSDCSSSSSSSDCCRKKIINLNHKNNKFEA